MPVPVCPCHYYLSGRLVVLSLAGFVSVVQMAGAILAPSLNVFVYRNDATSASRVIYTRKGSS
jgi:hypothetical protein